MRVYMLFAAVLVSLAANPDFFETDWIATATATITILAIIQDVADSARRNRK